MVQMLFFIRFRAQLRRTKPELITSLENTVTEAVSAAGAEAETKHRVLTASFDEDRIGFWLDMVIFLEKIHKALGKAAGELYGYALALGHDIPEASFQMLCRRLCCSLSGKNESGSTGIWCSAKARNALEPYLVFTPRHRSQSGKADSRAGGRSYGKADGNADGSDEYRELREWKPFDKDRREYPYRKKIERSLGQGKNRNSVLLGIEFIGKRDGIHHYCANHLGDLPPLVVRFGSGYPRRHFPSGGYSLVCFADAYTPGIRSFISGAISAGNKPHRIIEELDEIHALLFRERLREEWSPYMKDQGRRFIQSLLTAYIAAVKTQLPFGVLILENLCQADDDTARVFQEVYSSGEKREGLLVLASENSPEESLSRDNSPEEKIKDWGGVFSRILKFNPEDFPAPERNDLPRGFPKDFPKDLWELSYNIFLLRRYFPAYLLPELFEEEGISRDKYLLALKMLKSLGVFGSEDPQPLIPDFALLAEEALGNRKEKIRSTVRKIILAWEGSRKLRPCFNLLRILSELGERAADALVLRSLKADVLNGTFEGIEEALEEGDFGSLVGAGNKTVLSYIYKTFQALVWGEKSDIERVFGEPPPSLAHCYNACKALVKTNLAAFYIAGRNFDAASEAVREAMHLNRDLGENAVPAYRLFSLVNLSRGRIDDALEYISFALEQAEKTEQDEELVLTCYFASSINFLYGNLSRAERLALRAEDTALAVGQAGWGTKARFLRGRISFELGRYEDALEIFESLGKTTESDGAEEWFPGIANTVRAWLNRTNTFLNRPSPINSGAVPASPDGRIFEIEAAYFASDYKRTKALAERFLSSHGEEPSENYSLGNNSLENNSTEFYSGEDFLFTEQPDWRSGFAQCEYMFMPGKTPGTRLAHAYRAMAQCNLHPSPEEKTEILGDMQRFIRDELLPDTNPNDTFYFYAWYCMLRDSGAAQVDMNTVVSMALKRLHRRAGRIDDIGSKQAFLTLPKWNNTLSLAAREYKLI